MTIRTDHAAGTGSPDRSERAGDAAATDDVATLHVHRAGSIDPAPFAVLLRDPSWLGQVVVDPALPGGSLRLLTDLQLPLPPDGRLLSLRKAAYVDVGPVSVVEDGVDVELAWRSASLAPMFPVFAGRLRVRSTGLTIDGHYAPPGGVVGRAADRMLLNTAARGTARWFLGHLAKQARSPEPSEWT